MKEWQELMNYIGQYIYVDAEEEIIIKHGPKAEEALAAYERGLSALPKEKDDDNRDFIFGNSVGLSKWEYDIALDCVRRMSEEDRDYVRAHMDTSEYHFGYAMGVRNKYIHPSKKHHYFEADGISSSVMRKIFALVSPVYDFRNPVITGFFEDWNFPHLFELYGVEQKEIFDEVTLAVDEGHYTSAHDAIKDLENKLREALGPEEFIRIFGRAWKEFKETEKANDREDWYWETNFPSCKAVLYPLWSKQMNILRRERLYDQIERRSIKSLEECRRYIDENVGLREEYADYMARCAWEVCNPVTTGKWKELGLYSLDLDYGIRRELEQAGIENLEDLCKRSLEQLTQIDNVGTENAEKIQREIEGMGLKLGMDS